MSSHLTSPLLHAACLPWLQGQPIVLGLSGGRDSVALLLLLLQAGCDVRPCHVHHGIRGLEAEEDLAFCRALCQEHGLALHETRVNVPELARLHRQSIETAARTARRAALAEAARQCGTRAIALAHHADDQAETVLFRLARGSAGLRGMQPVSEACGCLWLRPLLECPRSVLTRWLQDQGQLWREDATNACADVARNRIRHHVLPALAQAMQRDVVPIINRSARLQQETSEALEEALSALPLADPRGWLYLPDLLPMGASLRHAVLYRYLRLAGVPGVNEAMIQAVDALLPPEAPGSRLDLPGGFRVVRRQRRLFLQYGEHTVSVEWGRR